MRQKTGIWRTHTGITKAKGKIRNPENFAPGGPKWETENAKFFNILVPMGKARTMVYGEAFELLRSPVRRTGMSAICHI
jgi:hypothetical protein